MEIEEQKVDSYSIDYSTWNSDRKRYATLRIWENDEGVDIEIQDEKGHTERMSLADADIHALMVLFGRRLLGDQSEKEKE